MFLIFVAASKYGKIRMGRSDSKPEYNDISWFCMLFSCEHAVGVYTFACMETMTFYRHYRGAGRASLENDDDVAQAAILQLFYHWGFHSVGAVHHCGYHARRHLIPLELAPHDALGVLPPPR